MTVTLRGPLTETRLTLSPGEIATATTIAGIRQGVNRERGITNQKAGPQDPITTELVGMLGELAFARWANVCPDLSTHLRAGTPDAVFRGYTVDVKSTRNPLGPLYVDPRPDKAPDVYVLVHIEYAACTLLGWVWRSELNEYLTPEENRIPVNQLTEMRWLAEIEHKP